MQRIITLAVMVYEEMSPGLMAVNLVLYREDIYPGSIGGDAGGLLDLPLRLLPTLDDWAADALRHALASLADHEVPAALTRRIRAVIPQELRFVEPLQGVTKEDFPKAVTSVLRLNLRPRAKQD